MKDSQFKLDPRRNKDYERLFHALVAIGKMPDIIIHSWSLTNDGQESSGPAYFAQVQPFGFYSLLYTAKALSKLDIQKSIHIEVISNGVYALGNNLVQPEKATLLGPCRVIPQEMTNLTCRYVDIVGPSQGTRQSLRLTNQLIAGILETPSNGIFAMRDGQRWEQCFEPIRLTNEITGIGPLRENGVYLITGGLGKIGLRLAEYLARKVQARIVLTSRSIFPKRENWEEWLSSKGEDDDTTRKIRRIQDMEKLGAEIIVCSADVADRSAMQTLVVQIYDRWGSLNGVFHAAGVMKDINFVQDITPIQCEGHFQPKVHGLYVLEQVLQECELDFCFLLSSLSSVLGGLGLAAYAAANNFMDAKARKFSQQDSVRWLSVNWDGWQKDEEETSLNALGGTLTQLAIEPEQGVDAFHRILLSEHVESQLVVSTGDLTARINQWIKLETLRDEEYQKQATIMIFQSRPPLANDYVAPRNGLEETLVSIWEELLGIEQIGIYDNLFELGGHSLLATQMASRLRRTFNIELSIKLIFDAPRIADLAEALMQKSGSDQANVQGQGLEEILQDIESLSDADAEAALKNYGNNKYGQSSD